MTPSQGQQQQQQPQKPKINLRKPSHDISSSKQFHNRHHHHQHAAPPNQLIATIPEQSQQPNNVEHNQKLSISSYSPGGQVSQKSRTTTASISPPSRCSCLRGGHRRLLPLHSLLLLLLCLTSRSVLSAPSPDAQSASANSVVQAGTAAVGSAEVMLPKDANWLKGYEPSCDELRAMWRFSKRQSRASEITNEIPTFRADPFSLNMWPASKPMPNKQTSGRTRSAAGRYMYDRGGKLTRNTARNGFGFPQHFFGLGPVYGKVKLHQEPELMEFGYPMQQPPNQPLRKVQYRFPGPSPGNSAASAGVARMSGGGASLNVTPQRGSFSKLKELVWNERARELAHQRRSEEMAARAAVLKELANGGHG